MTVEPLFSDLLVLSPPRRIYWFGTSKSFDLEVCWSVGLFVCQHVLGHNFGPRILIFFPL